MQVKKALTTFCTEAKFLLNEQDRKGVYKLVANCKFLESYVDMKVLTDRVTAKAEAGIRTMVKEASKTKTRASSSSSNNDSCYLPRGVLKSFNKR